MENENKVAIATYSLTKSFGGMRRVDGVSMTVMRGEIYGLIGKNGAGKTTLMRMILGISAPDEGEVEIDGARKSSELTEKRRSIGALIEQPAFYGHLSAKENIAIYAKSTGIGKVDADALIELVGLNDAGKKRVKNFSLGMKQRLALAMALSGNPEILFLDEPVNGLDPTGIVGVRELITRLNREHGTTVVISSHLLGELGRLATAYGIMKDGRLVKEFRGAELASLERPSVKVVVAERERAEKFMKQRFPEGSYRLDGNLVEIYSDLPDPAAVSRMFVEGGIAVMQLTVGDSNLESAFIAYM